MRNAETLYGMFIHINSTTSRFNNGDSTNAASKPLSWYLPRAKSAAYVFYGASVFNQNIGSWFTPQNGATFEILTLQSMFDGASLFNNGNSDDINDWRTPTNTSLDCTFSRAAVFNQPLDDWDVSGVKDLDWLFNSATAFNNGDTGNFGTRPLSWNISKAETAYEMFDDAVSFNQYVGDWDPASLTTAQRMFRNAQLFNNGDTTDASSKPLAWASTAALTNMTTMFQNAYSFNQDMSSFNTSNVTLMVSLFQNATSFNRDISGWDVSKVTNFASIFNGSASFKRNLSAWNLVGGTTFTSMLAAMDINDPGTTDNYDNLLLRIAEVTTQNSKGLGSVPSRYSYTGNGSAASGTGRAHLTASLTATPTAGHAWTITDTTANCTFSSSSGLLMTCTGDRPTFSRVVLKTNGTLPTGLTAGTTYWTVRVSATTSRLATSLANAQAGTVIPFTDSGSGTHAAMITGHVVPPSNSSGNLLLTLSTGGDLSFSGRKVRFVTTGSLPTGLSAGVDYRLNRTAATTYRVTTTAKDAALGANFIPYSDTGSGTMEVLLQP
jgi:surface protein